MTDSPFAAAAPRAVVSKRQARSNPKIEHLEPVVLKDGRDITKAHLRFIPHEGRETELSLKVSREGKSALGGNPEVAITLDDGALQALAQYLERGQVFRDSAAGRYILIPLDGNTPDLEGKNLQNVTQALLQTLSNQDIAQNIFTAELSPDFARTLQYAARASQIEAALAELQNLIEATDTREQQLQAWLQTYAWIFGTEFVSLENVRQFDRNHKLDALVRGFSGFCDVIELKKSSMEVLVWDDSHKGFFFSKDTSAAIGQTITYLERLHAAARRGLEDAEHIKAFYPHGTIVIGRSHDWDEAKHKALIGLNEHLHRLRVITYDQLLAIGRNVLSTLTPDGDNA